MSQSGSTLRQAFSTAFMVAFSSAPSAKSTVIFWVMKLMAAAATPGVFWAACSIFRAQAAQSTSTG